MGERIQQKSLKLKNLLIDFIIISIYKKKKNLCKRNSTASVQNNRFFFFFLKFLNLRSLLRNITSLTFYTGLLIQIKSYSLYSLFTGQKHDILRYIYSFELQVNFIHLNDLSAILKYYS